MESRNERRCKKGLGSLCKVELLRLLATFRFDYEYEFDYEYDFLDLETFKSDYEYQFDNEYDFLETFDLTTSTSLIASTTP